MRFIVFSVVSLMFLSCNSVKEEIAPSQVIVLPDETINYSYNRIDSIVYYNDSLLKGDYYKKSTCVLDLYYPIDKESFSTIIWLHGGGLTTGSRFFPDVLLNRGFAVVSMDYRLSPNAKCPSYIEDTAAAIDWVYKNIELYGGQKDKIYLVGYSAGAYLSMIVGLDDKWLSRYFLEPNNLAGVFSISGQLSTHSTILKEQSTSDSIANANEFAPLSYVKEISPKIFLYVGDRNKDIVNRFQENLTFYNRMRDIGNDQVSFIEFKNYDHKSVLDVSLPYVVRSIKELESISLKKN